MIAPAPDFEAAGYCRIADNLYSDTEAVAFSLPAIKGRAVQPDARPDAPPSQTQQHFMLIAALANLVQASAIVLYAAEDRDLVRSLSRLLKCKLFVVDDQQARIEAVFSPDMPDVKYIFSAAGNGFSLLDKQALLVDFSGTCSMAGQGFRHYLGYLAGTGLPASRSDHSGVFFLCDSDCQPLCSQQVPIGQRVTDQTMAGYRRRHHPLADFVFRRNL